MAWISVDQSLLGGKLRKLHKAIGCSRNEAVGILVSLWLWGVDNADEDGLIPGVDREDLEETVAAGLSDSLDPSAAVDKLIETGWLDETEQGYCIHDWHECQKYYSRSVREKKAHSERTRRYRERKKCDVTCDVHSDGHSDVTVAEQDDGNGTDPEPKKPEKYSDDFTEFWSVYPRKTDKGLAFKKYKARRNDGYSAEQLLTAAGRYSEECARNHTEQKYIKHAKTFLGEALPFTDYLKDPGEDQWQSGYYPGYRQNTVQNNSGSGSGADVNPFRNM